MTDQKTPALSPSIAHLLVTESPRHAWTYHRLLGGQSKPVTDEQERGRLFHALLLGQREKIVVVDADDFRKQAAKDERDEARLEGKIPIVIAKYTEALGIAARLGDTIQSLGYNLDAGIPETMLEWTIQAEAGPVLCHGIPDWVRRDRLQIIDLKTGKGSAHPDACAAALLRLGGCIQDAAYRQAVETHAPEIAGRVEVVFLFAQTSPPHCVTPIICGGTMREIGESRWQRALDLFSRYLARGREAAHWPPYADRPVVVEAPGWALAREISEEW